MEEEAAPPWRWPVPVWCWRLTDRPPPGWRRRTGWRWWWAPATCFEEPGCLEWVAALAGDWFVNHLGPG